jgi:hypothetical protein
MKLTFGRWLGVLAIGCALIVAAFVPAEFEMGDGWEQTQATLPAYGWSRRQAARLHHVRELIVEFRAAGDIELARSAFGSTDGAVGEPELVFEPAVPAAQRAEVIRALAAERAQRGEFKGRGKVGVVVGTDSAFRVGGRSIGIWPGGSRAARTRVVTPSPLTGDRCVSVVRIGKEWGESGEGGPGAASLLDACAFYDAFGAPGPQIQRELRADNLEFARGYRQTVAETDRSSRPFAMADYANQPYRRSRIVSSLACRAGLDSACLALTYGMAERLDLAATFWTGAAATRNGISAESPWSWLSTSAYTLEALAHDLGPARFARVWQSSGALADAYHSETGERLAQWSRRREERLGGVYVAGPWTPPLSAGLSLLFVAAVAGLTIRYVPRTSLV